MRYSFQCILAGLILFAFMNECVAAGKIISPEPSVFQGEKTVSMSIVATIQGGIYVHAEKLENEVSI